MGARLSETELQKSLDFCINLFTPTVPDDHERVSRRSPICAELMDMGTPLIHPSVLESALSLVTESSSSSKKIDDPEELDSDADSDEGLSETRVVLEKINARRVVHAEYSVNNLEVEYLEGLAVVLEQGKLGLRKKDSSV